MEKFLVLVGICRHYHRYISPKRFEDQFVYIPSTKSNQRYDLISIANNQASPPKKRNLQSPLPPKKTFFFPGPLYSLKPSSICPIPGNPPISPAAPTVETHGVWRCHQGTTASARPASLGVLDVKPSAVPAIDFARRSAWMGKGEGKVDIPICSMYGIFTYNLAWICGLCR